MRFSRDYRELRFKNTTIPLPYRRVISRWQLKDEHEAAVALHASSQPETFVPAVSRSATTAAPHGKGRASCSETVPFCNPLGAWHIAGWWEAAVGVFSSVLFAQHLISRSACAVAAAFLFSPGTDRVGGAFLSARMVHSAAIQIATLALPC